MNTMSSIVIAGLMTLTIMTIANRDKIVLYYRIFMYPALADTYDCASIKRIKIGGDELNRNHKVKFYVPHVDQYVEGLFIGVDEVMYVLVNMERIILLFYIVL